MPYIVPNGEDEGLMQALSGALVAVDAAKAHLAGCEAPVCRQKVPQACLPQSGQPDSVSCKVRDRHPMQGKWSAKQRQRFIAQPDRLKGSGIWRGPTPVHASTRLAISPGGSQ
jgi:hypothetical protein